MEAKLHDLKNKVRGKKCMPGFKKILDVSKNSNIFSLLLFQNPYSTLKYNQGSEFLWCDFHAISIHAYYKTQKIAPLIHLSSAETSFKQPL